MMWKVRHISQTVAAPPAAVIAVAGDPRRLPEWAAGLSSGIRDEGGRWFTDSPMGTVEVRFTGPVDLGIFDHDVSLPDGTLVTNPLRVVPNGGGSEVIFSVFQRDGMTNEEFEADVRTVTADLERLRSLVVGP